LDDGGIFMHINKYKNLYYLGLAVSMLWLLSYLAIRIYVDFGNRGTFGDTFGAVNSLFAGLAFAGIIYTITLQNEQLKLQSNQMDMQINQLKSQNDQLVLQREDLVLQRQDLELQREILKLQVDETH
jgi:hypothetical protein